MLLKPSMTEEMTTKRARETVVELFGTSAVGTAMRCALVALSDGEREQSDRWLTVCREIKEDQKRSGEVGGYIAASRRWQVQKS